MTLKEILGKIKASLGTDIPAETVTLLADAERQLADFTESKKAADRESADRKEKIRELETKITQLETDVAKANTPEAKAELDRLKKLETDYNAMLKADADKQLAAWNEKAKLLSTDPTNKNADKVTKVIGRFAMPKEGETLTSDQIRANLATMELLESTGYFATETKPAGGASPADPANPATPARSSGEAMLKATQPVN